MNLSIKIKILIFILISQAFAMAIGQHAFSIIPLAQADSGGDGDGDDGDDGDSGGDDGGHDGDDGDDGDSGGDDGASDSDSSDSGGGDDSDIDEFLDYYNEIEDVSGLMAMQEIERSIMMDEEVSLIGQSWSMNALVLDTKDDIKITINMRERDEPLLEVGSIKIENRVKMIDRLADIKYPLIRSNTSNDIAVIIANENYDKSIDIPDNDPASRDAEAFKVFAINGLGISEGNIILINNATQANFLRVFGSESNYKGQLFDWVKKDKSRVYVYYAGHGAPSNNNDSFLIPSDSDSARLDLNGYRLSTLYNNLSKIPSKETMVILESCFSGVSQNGKTVNNASPIYARSSSITPPKGIKVISATHANQVASWEPDTSHGMFTQYFLKAMSGEADIAPYGNNDGTVSMDELDIYLKDTLTYWARRHYGRDQVAEIIAGK